MPHCNKAEDNEHVQYCAEATDSAPGSTTAKRNVEIPNSPAIEGAMPTTPEGKGRIVVGHATNHVFRRVDAVNEGPEAEEAPRKEQFEPDDVQVEVAEHGELKGRVAFPIWVGL